MTEVRKVGRKGMKSEHCWADQSEETKAVLLAQSKVGKMVVKSGMNLVDSKVERKGCLLVG